MAKLGTRTAHEVVKIHATKADATWLYAYRSDGKILRRLTKVAGRPVSGGYSIMGTVATEVHERLRTGPLTFDHDATREALRKIIRNFADMVPTD